MNKYQPQQIEKKWQRKWENDGLYKFDLSSDKPKYYDLVELPYPSGDLHIGHWFAFTVPDVLGRFKKMSGFNVLFPPGFDAFGLPAENAAIKRKIHPKDWTESNIANMTRQFKTMGAIFDWDHEAITCEPEYYKWNQWIFIKMFERNIAYRAKTLSNWCPLDQTVLANEHVEAGKCWRCGSEVVQKEVEQWFLRITDYADRLVWTNNSRVNWPMSVRTGQNDWIGRKEGILIKYEVPNLPNSPNTPNHPNTSFIEVFTTRADTLFGATFLVINPEHPLLNQILASESKDEVLKYVDLAGKKTELERKENKEKTGVFTGGFVKHPITGEKIPVWVADYVLAGYGTGAIMAVPAHDDRDFEFAKKFNLPVIPVISPNHPNIPNLPYLGPGKLINSDKFTGMDWEEGKKKIAEYLESKDLGSITTQYHLHDWSVSRQRYWGTPVPMIHCPKCGIVPVPESDLPIELPYDVDFTPKGKPPLASNEEWLKTRCPKCGGDAKRDAETLDTFFDSSWYYYRYLSPHYNQAPFDPELVKKFMPVDIYFGGAEHTLGHTLYARFFTKFFKDLKLIDFDEFALRRVQHGIVLGPDGAKMSKSKGNVINPDDVVAEYGADTTRAYLCFMMPYEGTAPWSTEAISGMYRFLKRVWELFDLIDEDFEPGKEDLVFLNQSIDKVTRDLEAIKCNTALAQLMTWLNFLSSRKKITKKEYEIFLTLLAPFAPHITEELWEQLQFSVLGSQLSDIGQSVPRLTGQQTTGKPNSENRKQKTDNWSIHLQPWPSVDQNYLESETSNIVIQVNGKVRDNILADKNIGEEDIKKLAMKSIKVQKFIDGKTIKKTIFVPGKILNLVV